jgi:C4-dicarboxylate-specific signal transduction histidine kinase
MNLFSNAKDALEEHRTEDREIEIVVRQEGANAIIDVIDNGGGFSESVHDRMFEPYFTTKHKASGTGIGLHMSKQIIEKQMQGSISATTVAYTFHNGQHYSQCAMVTIVIPLEKKEEKSDGF